MVDISIFMGNVKMPEQHNNCMQSGFLIDSIPPINPSLILLYDFATLEAFPQDNGFEAGA